MVNLNILCVMLTVFSSNTAAPNRRHYHVSDLPDLESNPGPNFRATTNESANASKTNIPEVHYVNVNSANNKTSAEADSKPGYGDEWVYALHTDDGQAEWLDLTKAHNYETSDVMANRSLEFMSLQLFTRRNKDAPENLTVDPYFLKPILRSKFFERKKRTKVLAHGWSPESIGIAEFKNLTSLYLELGDFNVIYVEWSAVSSEEYILACILYPYVARRLSVLLKAIIDTYNYKQDIHLIGHGMGAHILGYAAELSEKTIARITGLDPERPFFENPKSKTHMLTENDAIFVDIIHTSKGIRGYKRNHGHLDFYPNDGKSPQPGCTGYKVLQETCSHFRAVFYYIESLVTEKHFYSYACKDFEKGTCDKKHTLMGEHVYTNLRGTYYLHTNDTEPFALGKHRNPKEEPNIQPKIKDRNPPDPCDEDEEPEEDENKGGENKGGENKEGENKGNETDTADANKDKEAAGDKNEAEPAAKARQRKQKDENYDVWSDEIDGDEGVDMDIPVTRSPKISKVRRAKVSGMANVSQTTSVQVTHDYAITTIAKATSKVIHT